MTVMTLRERNAAKREPGAYISIGKGTKNARLFVVVEWRSYMAHKGRLRVIDARTEYTSMLDGAEVDAAILEQLAPKCPDRPPEELGPSK